MYLKKVTIRRECVRLVFENLPLLLREPENIEARQAMLLAAHYGGNAINTQLAGYVHAFAHSIGGKYHIPHGKAIAWCLTPVMAAQEHLCAVQMAERARHCALAREDDDEGKAADNMLLAIRQLMRTCGLEEGCLLIREEDFSDLTQLITQDSVNYSPPVVFSDNEIHMLLNQIRRGF